MGEERGVAVRPVQAKIVRRGGPANSVRFSAAVARAICARLEAGETLRGICGDADMPHRSSVQAWATALPGFAAAMARARRAAGWHGEAGRPPRWCPHLAAEVCARVAGGETLSAACEDADMPSLSLVYRWRASRPDFAADLELARQAQAERIADEGLAIARAITPKDAFATHVRLTHLRWMTGVLSPARFGRLRPLEAEGAQAREVRRVIFQMREFKTEPQPDGSTRVVAYLRNPKTGELELEEEA